MLISKAQCTDGTCDCHCTCCILCTYPRDNYCEFCEAGWGGTINNRCQRSKNNSSISVKEYYVHMTNLIPAVTH